MSRVVQEFCKSDQAFGNAIVFSSGLDLGEISVARPLRRSGQARAMWRARKLRKLKGK